MKNVLLSNWDAARILRTVLGAGLGVYAVATSEYILLAFALWLLLQGFLNISCCGTACESHNDKPKKHDLFRGQIKKYKP
jgi:uncharacterized membrane protein HdeD (DUF308 family)